MPIGETFSSYLWFADFCAHWTNKCVLIVPSGKGSIILYISGPARSRPSFMLLLMNDDAILSRPAHFFPWALSSRQIAAPENGGVTRRQKNHRPSKKSSEIEFLIFLFWFLLYRLQSTGDEGQIASKLPRTRSPALKWSCRIVKKHLIGADVRSVSARVIHVADFGSNPIQVPRPLKGKRISRKKDWRISEIQWIDLLNLRSTTCSWGEFNLWMALI